MGEAPLFTPSLLAGEGWGGGLELTGKIHSLLMQPHPPPTAQCAVVLPCKGGAEKFNRGSA
jgi:hypothetical protein